MIVFVPAYDPQTRANLHIARRLVPGSGHADAPITLFEHAADRVALASLLVINAGPLFAMSHGRQDQLLGNGGQPAISEDDEAVLTLLGARAVFAYACHTATRLGRLAAEHGATWWGYTGKLQCPVDQAPFDQLFIGIFQLIADRFWAATSHASRSVLLDELKTLCELAAREIDEVGDAHPDADTFSAQLCALHVWDRLRIWSTGEEGPEHHPEARPPTLMLD